MYRAFLGACALLALTLSSPPAIAQTLLHALASPNGEEGDEFGEAVSGVPDVDGDGRGDLLVGATGGGNGFVGRVYLFSGTTGDLFFELASPNAIQGGCFGCAVSGVPDVDGDGRGDLLIGAYGEDFILPGVGDGRAYLFNGASGALLHPLVSPDPRLGGAFGVSVSAVPDVNGDGRPDLLVGAPGEGPGPSPQAAGRAHVFSGATGELLHTLQSPSEQRYGYFGNAVAGVPDADGDGFGDLLVGAYNEDPGPSPHNAGRAYVFSGATGALLYRLRSPSEEGGGEFGGAVSGVADVDGDGRGDLLVGASQEGLGGRAYVFSGATGTRLHTLRSPNEEDWGHFGLSVSGLPDVDGDGRGDALIGAPFETVGALAFAGRAYLFSGAEGDLLGTLTSPAPLDQQPSEFGRAVSGVPDANGDGRYDLLVGAPIGDTDLDPDDQGNQGRAYLFSGATLAPLSLTARALNSPVPRGGRLRFEVTLTNQTPAPLTGDLRLDVTAPNGATYGRPLVKDGTLPVNQTVTQSFELPVPAVAPLGTYEAEVTALSGGGNVVATADFTFEIVAGAGPAGGADAGEAPGEAAAPTGSAHASAEPAAAGVSPNPTSVQAELTFSLKAPSEVRMALYDVLGREVTAVDAGRLESGTHRLGIDVSGLPAGVYVWRLAAGGRIESGRLTVAR
jgi:hypothetical protein